MGSGKVVRDIPRDRNGTFDPMLVAKYQRRFREFYRKIIGMYARGMTIRENHGHIEEFYGVETSPGLISALADAVREDLLRFDAAPLIAFFAAKETNYGTETDGRIPG